MGSLVTALASYCSIKQAGGEWLVRIDDLDPPRQDPNAVNAIIRCLTAHGLHPDRPIIFQSDHAGAYESALQKLAPNLFYCKCSRKKLRAHDRYPGTCREARTPLPDRAVRVLLSDTEHGYCDGFLGSVDGNFAAQLGDFIVRRRDGLISYNLATAVDDGNTISEVLRGQDLLPVTAPQRYLMQLLGLTAPDYTHIPCLEFADGTKLSKQTHAPPLNEHSALANLRAALGYLGFHAPDAIDSVGILLNWSIAHFDLSQIPTKLPKYQPS
jgi:glutamyl-Q tRNA(Asp) synthetase